MADRTSVASAPGAGNWLLGKILFGVAVVLMFPSFALAFFGGVVWLQQAGSAASVNPNAPLFFLLGLCGSAATIWIGLVGYRMSGGK